MTVYSAMFSVGQQLEAVPAAALLAHTHTATSLAQTKAGMGETVGPGACFWIQGANDYRSKQRK